MPDGAVDFSIPSAGSTLSGDVHPPAPGVDSAVLFSHGLTNNRDDAPLFDGLRAALRAEGFGLVTFDYFGSGLSDGQFEDKTLSVMRQNLADVLRHVPTMLGPVKLGLFGRSLGATLCGLHLSSPAVRCAVLASPVVDLVDAFEFMRGGMGGGTHIALPADTHPPSGQLKGAYRLGRTFFDELDPCTKDLERALRKASRPVLVIQGMRDEKLSVSHARAAVEMLGADGVYDEVDGAGHNYEGCESRVVAVSSEWFSRYLS